MGPPIRLGNTQLISHNATEWISNLREMYTHLGFTGYLDVDGNHSAVPIQMGVLQSRQHTSCASPMDQGTSGVDEEQ